jgi:ribosomal-protein-alanine N-acetyltransferase
MNLNYFISKRLVLRPFNENDLDTLYRYRNDERCAKYQTWTSRSRQELSSFIDELKTRQLGVSWIQLAIALKTNNQLVGDIYLDFDLHTISLGYTIDYLYHRQGYAFEIIQELLIYLGNNYPHKQVVAKVFTANQASINLLLKLDFKKVGIIEKEDTYVYSYQLR